MNSAAVLFLIACSPKEEPNDVESAAAVVVIPETEGPNFKRAGFRPQEEDPAEHWAYGMRCTPEDANANDVLRLQFLRPRGGEVEILSPSGSWFFYALPDDPRPSPNPMVDGNAIADADSVGIKLSRASGQKIGTAKGPLDEWCLEPIFTEGGIYSILVSSNIEVGKEDVVLDAYCHFNFRSKS